MKKILLIVAVLAISMPGWAQKKNIQSAKNYLRDKEYMKALEYIELAVKDPSTKDDPKAWFVRGNIFMAMEQDGGFKNESPYRQAAESFRKSAALKPEYEKAAVTQALLVSGYNYYNDAANAYNAKNYDEAYTYAQQLDAIHDFEEGKRFGTNKSFDTIAVQGKVIGAYSAYYSKNYDNAIPLLNELKDDPIGRSANIYLLLADIYKAQNNDASYVALIEEGRKAFPEDQNIRNEELNYYIRTGKQAELMQKLEAAVKADPNNAELQFNLANGYMNMAFPKEGDKPANYQELISKAEAAYEKALQISPNNAEYNYNMGALYYNQATEIIEKMNDIASDRSAAAQKAYGELEPQRDALFAKALPYLEKTIATFEAKLSSLRPEDKFTYNSSLAAAKEIYARQNKLDKAAELKKKQDAIPVD